MPLYVTNGKLQLGDPGRLAAQRACCCNEEGDDPGDCVCPDLCLYRIDVVSPVSAVLPATPCLDVYSSGPQYGSGGYGCNGIDDTELQKEFGQATRVEDSVYAFAGLAIPYGQPTKGNYLQGGGAVGGMARLYCRGSKLLLDVSWGVSVTKNAGLGRSKGYAITAVELPYQCSRKTQSSCSANNLRANYLRLPIEFSVSMRSPGIVGSWGQPVSDYLSGNNADVNACFENLLDFAATFRITQRDSCQVCSTWQDCPVVNNQSQCCNNGVCEPCAICPPLTIASPWGCGAAESQSCRDKGGAYRDTCPPGLSGFSFGTCCLPLQLP